MDKQRELAHKIIDLVEVTIRQEHPSVEDYASRRCTGNTLVYGEAYYYLEDKITELLKEQ